MYLGMGQGRSWSPATIIQKTLVNAEQPYIAFTKQISWAQNTCTTEISMQTRLHSRHPEGTYSTPQATCLDLEAASRGDETGQKG